MTSRFQPRHGLVVTLLGALLCAAPAYATVETLYDNDTNGMVPGPAATDRNYTFGLHAAWYGEPDVMPRWTERIAQRLGGAGPDAVRRLSFFAGQELYTPDSLSDPHPILNDRPYAAWLFAAATLSNADERRARSLTVRVGMIGPDAQGQELQTWWHHREHIRLPRGWRYQLANEPGLGVTLDERWRPYGRQRYADIVPHLRFTAGNVLTEAAAGATLRVGLPLANDFGPGAPSGPEDYVRGFRLYGFARAEGRAVARDIFLDGNTFQNSLRVHRVPLVGETQLGLGLRHGAMGARYMFSYTTRQFHERPAAQEYGSIVISF
jgi:hypothetical protein